MGYYPAFSLYKLPFWWFLVLTAFDDSNVDDCFKVVVVHTPV